MNLRRKVNNVRFPETILASVVSCNERISSTTNPAPLD